MSKVENSNMKHGDIVYILNSKNEPTECIFSEYWNDNMVYIVLDNKSVMVQEKEVFKSEHIKKSLSIKRV